MKAIEGLEFRAGYWDDPAATAQFRRFLLEIHGLDLSLWERRGFWDHENYTAFSLFDGDRVVATTNLFSLEMVVEGHARRLGQFSGVGTLPALRRRGFNRWLTERALESAGAAHDGFFLFADEQAKPFYARCGFVPFRETLALLEVQPPAPRPGLVKLDPERDEDLRRIYRLACERSPVSDLLGCRSAKLLMFHCLYTLRDRLHYLPDLDVAVFFETRDERLVLFDVVGRRVPTFAELHPFLASEPHREVVFCFWPDKMRIEPSATLDLTANHAHLLPPLRLPRPFCLIPYTAHA